MKLIDPTDDQLNAAFAEKVCGWAIHERNTAWWVDADERTGMVDKGVRAGVGELRFTNSADAVLPWLEKHRFEATYWNGWRIRIICWEENGENMFADDKSLPRAAVIALLRAHGVEVEFTKQP